MIPFPPLQKLSGGFLPLLLPFRCKLRLYKLCRQESQDPGRYVYKTDGYAYLYGVSHHTIAVDISHTQSQVSCTLCHYRKLSYVGW